MASSKEYLDFVLEQCAGLSARAMMGEYVLYYGGKVVGGIYDNRLLVKPTPSAIALMPQAPREMPYEGAKEMLLGRYRKQRIFAKVVRGNVHRAARTEEEMSINFEGERI